MIWTVCGGNNIAIIWVCIMAHYKDLFLSAFFHCTIQVDFGTVDDNVVVMNVVDEKVSFFPSVIVMGLCSVPYYSRNLWFFMTI